MNYKLNNPVALKVIKCLMLDKPVATKKVVECAKFFDYNLHEALCFCLRHRIISYKDANYIYRMYNKTFENIIKDRNHKLSMRNVTR